MKLKCESPLGSSSRGGEPGAPPGRRRGWWKRRKTQEPLKVEQRPSAYGGGTTSLSPTSWMGSLRGWKHTEAARFSGPGTCEEEHGEGTGLGEELAGHFLGERKIRRMQPTALLAAAPGPPHRGQKPL